MNKFLKGLSMLPFMALAGVTMLSTASAQEAVIKFNKWDGVAHGIEDESNFVRINDEYGAESAEACEDGQKVNVWLYMHNGTSDELNGENYDGPGVAENTVMSVSQSPNNGASQTHTITGSISADDVDTVTDTVTITCGSEAVELKYNGVVSFNATQEDFKLKGDPINGAQVGFEGGRVPGCWDYRATLVVQFEVVKEDEPETFALECNVLALMPIAGKEDAYSIKVNASSNPEAAATVSGGVINITDDKDPHEYEFSPSVTVDGNMLTVAEYTFPEVEGTYIVKATVDFTVNDGYATTSETSAMCERNINITVDEPPKETPEQPIVKTLPRTGAGTNIALFAAVAVASSFAYRKYITSRMS